MKKFLLLILIPLLYGCKTEEDAGPAKENTFIRYFGTQENNEAVLALEDGNGDYVLLSNTIIDRSGVTVRKFKFIKTDRYGNQVGPDVNYPATDLTSYTVSSFIASGSGYIIVGDRIKSSDPTKLLIMRLNQDGSSNAQDSLVISGPNNKGLHGHAVWADDNGELIVLGKVEDNLDMYVARLDNNLNILWSRTYGAGQSTLVNRVYKSNNNQNILWGGYVLNEGSNKYDVRLVRVPEDSETPIIGNPIGEPDIDETAYDICPAIGGWGITGSVGDGIDNDIYVMKVTSESSSLFYTVLRNDNAQNDKGVSIDETSDGGFIVLGVVGTSQKKDDLTLAKINGSGLPDWQYNYGGADRQDAASVRQTSDGSFLVFGTTYFINERKLMLMKVSKNGKL